MNEQSLDGYAESMFRFERLHPRWIEACAKYLRHVFGDALEGRVFLDYAFGRGNWSLAALQAGAARVVAVDAAAGNVRRFWDYCRSQDIGGVDIIHGDVLDHPIARSCDILWIYGVLPCISEPNRFLDEVLNMRSGDDALAFLYCYDRGSFREVIVDAARQCLVYPDARSFSEDSLLFTPRARLRGRDDLTAPAVLWYDAGEMVRLAERHGLSVARQVPDFGEWIAGTSSREFSPYNLLCRFGAMPHAAVVEPRRGVAIDLSILRGSADAVTLHASADERRRISIGLFNTHFSALPSDGSIERALLEDFLFLTHAALRLDVSLSAFADLPRRYHAAVLAATVDARRDLLPADIENSVIARHISANTVRF